MPERIQVYDTTLRDGTQREGISLSGVDKLRIAHQLDDLGVAFIENPTAALDKSCVAGLAATFVLPEGQAGGQALGNSQ